jgi:hypothetical protein
MNMPRHISLVGFAIAGTVLLASAAVAGDDSTDYEMTAHFSNGKCTGFSKADTDTEPEEKEAEYEWDKKVACDHGAFKHKKETEGEAPNTDR